MSKPTKYTPDTTKRFLDAVRSGFTVKIACVMSGVADMTLSRWRRRHPDFDAEFKKPQRSNPGMAGRLSKGLDSGFTRENLIKHPQSKEKALRRQINGFGGQNQQSEIVMYEGLPVRFGGNPGAMLAR